VAQGEPFRILNADEPGQRAEWLVLWQAWPDREVFAHPGYVALFSPTPDHAICAAWNSPTGGVLFPLILREIDQEQWAGKSGGLVDLTSPYGYGGPFVWGDVDDGAFWRQFQNWARSTGAVSCFARLSLFGDALLSQTGSELINAPNVVRSLDLAPDALWMDYEHKVRKNVKRAQREGVYVERDRSGARIDDFLSIYEGTMDRRGASAAYYFGKDFFLRLIRDLDGQFVFFHAFHDRTLISTELVLVSATHIYSFLGGTRAEAFDLRPNDFLKHEIILWGQRSGKRAFVLGGGYGGPDGIFRHKLSFAPNGETAFRTSQMVFDSDAYNHLVAMRAAWEIRQGREWQPRPGFFPAYRA
jgi:hypothetical protein